MSDERTSKELVTELRKASVAIFACVDESTAQAISQLFIKAIDALEQQPAPEPLPVTPALTEQWDACLSCGQPAVPRAAPPPFELLEIIRALQPFAAMDRPGGDLGELACQRGIASDMTILTSLDFRRAAELLAKLQRALTKEAL